MMFFVGDFHQSKVAWSGLTQVVHLVYVIMTVFWPVCIGVCLIGFLLGYSARSHKPELHRSSAIRVAALTSWFAFAGLLWIRYRWIIARDNPDWPRPWPYPDTVLLAFHNWLDAQLPAGSGQLKLHAEYYNVLGIIHVCGMVALGIVMVFVGIFSPRILSGETQRANSLESSTYPNPGN